MTQNPAPRCSVRFRPCLRRVSHHELTQHQAFSSKTGLLGHGLSGTVFASTAWRMWKERARSLRAMATVAIFLPRR